MNKLLSIISFVVTLMFVGSAGAVNFSTEYEVRAPFSGTFAAPGTIVQATYARFNATAANSAALFLAKQEGVVAGDESLVAVRARVLQGNKPVTLFVGGLFPNGNNVVSTYTIATDQATQWRWYTAALSNNGQSKLRPLLQLHAAEGGAVLEVEDIRVQSGDVIRFTDTQQPPVVDGDAIPVTWRSGMGSTIRYRNSNGDSVSQNDNPAWVEVMTPLFGSPWDAGIFLGLNLRQPLMSGQKVAVTFTVESSAPAELQLLLQENRGGADGMYRLTDLDTDTGVPPAVNVPAGTSQHTVVLTLRENNTKAVQVSMWVGMNSNATIAINAATFAVVPQ